MITSLNIKGNIFDLEKPVVMGILNATPDSFFDGGKNNSVENGLEKAKEMLEEGASVIDIGGYSTRPNALDVSIEDEINRIIPIIKGVKERYKNCTISVDTFRRKVAEKAIENGADIVNDISGGELDKTMFDFIKESKVPYIMMHSKGTPKTMMNLENTSYEDLINDIFSFFAKKIANLREAGICDIILDPGFGFSKTIDQNYELLKKMHIFRELHLPLLVGVSRKSMIYKELSIESKDALAGTIALNMFSLQQGASILRVHDVKEAVHTIRLYNKLT